MGHAIMKYLMNYGFIVVVLSLLGILFHIFIATYFGDIADEKGYRPFKYILICLFFPVAGWFLVMALPDKTLPKRIAEELRNTLQQDVNSFEEYEYEE